MHDFKKDVDKKTRDIGETQRKIASLSGSTDPADIALRRKLEAELRGQQEDLDETFYDHAKEAQLNALDEEAEAYEKSQNEKIKVLEKTLEDTETLITNAIMDMLINADTVLEQINTTAGLYGVSLSEELIAPWKDAAIKAGEYKEWIKTNIHNGDNSTIVSNNEKNIIPIEVVPEFEPTTLIVANPRNGKFSKLGNWVKKWREVTIQKFRANYAKRNVITNVILTLYFLYQKSI